ncbi:helix-turn-helix transcriptional regulator, partial [Balneolaceae bacterium ANBcel3]|nr:helix-turn-helix transcriptional regulator [Balneolaceae bacterium ANBcel3]
VAREAGVSRSTVWSIERGSGGISLGILIRVLAVYGLEEEVLRIASDDPEGRKLQDLALIPTQKKTKRKRES